MLERSRQRNDAGAKKTNATLKAATAKYTKSEKERERERQIEIH